MLKLNSLFPFSQDRNPRLSLLSSDTVRCGSVRQVDGSIRVPGNFRSVHCPQHARSTDSLAADSGHVRGQ